jgi:hypothetical protein
VLQICRPHPVVGNAHGFGLDTRAAEGALLESLRDGTVHPSLAHVEEPQPRAAEHPAFP